MSARRIVGIILLAGGILALLYGGFSYEKKKGDIDIGPVEIELTKKERVNVPVWAGAAALVIGLVLVALPERR